MHYSVFLQIILSLTLCSHLLLCNNLTSASRVVLENIVGLFLNTSSFGSVVFPKYPDALLQGM